MICSIYRDGPGIFGFCQLSYSLTWLKRLPNCYQLYRETRTAYTITVVPSNVPSSTREARKELAIFVFFLLLLSFFLIINI